MADMNDLAQKIAFYQAGGKDPGTDTLDKVNAGFGSIDSAIKDVLAIKKAKVEGEKTNAETKKLQIGNTPANEIVGTPLVKTQIAEAENAPIPTEDLLSGRLDNYQSGIDKATGTARNMQQKFGNMTMDQYKDYNEANKLTNPTESKEDLLPVSRMMTFDEVKKIRPVTTPQEYATMTIGGLRQHIAAAKQIDLNNSRDKNLDLRVNNAIIATGNELMNVLRPLREQKMALASSLHLNDLVKAGNTVAAAALGAQQARAVSERGVLTDADVARYVRSGFIPQRIADIMTTWFAGKPSSATLEEIGQVNEYIKQAIDRKEKELIDQASNRIVANYGIDPQEAIQRLGYHVNNDGYSIASPMPQATQPVTRPAGTDADLTNKIQSQLPQGAKIKSIRKVQ